MEFRCLIFIRAFRSLNFTKSIDLISNYTVRTPVRIRLVSKCSIEDSVIYSGQDRYRICIVEPVPNCIFVVRILEFDILHSDHNVVATHYLGYTHTFYGQCSLSTAACKWHRIPLLCLIHI